jgi:hypothetical protein
MVEVAGAAHGTLSTPAMIGSTTSLDVITLPLPPQGRDSDAERRRRILPAACPSEYTPYVLFFQLIQCGVQRKISLLRAERSENRVR